MFTECNIFGRFHHFEGFQQIVFCMINIRIFAYLSGLNRFFESRLSGSVYAWYPQIDS